LSGHPIIAQLLSRVQKEISESVVEQEGSEPYGKEQGTMDHFLRKFDAFWPETLFWWSCARILVRLFWSVSCSKLTRCP